MSLRFVFCVEAGRLEGESILLCESIRRFGGRYADSPIVAYRPRAGAPLADDTVARFGAIGVDLVQEPLNVEHDAYALANKVHSLVHAEREWPEDVLVLSDSDSVVLAEPARFDLEDGIDAAVTPVGRISDGSTGQGHKNEPYWQRLYELTGTEERPFTKTAIKRVRIRAYWNTGLVCMRRESRLADDWLEMLKVLIDTPHLPKRGINHAEQLSLAAVLSRRPDRVLNLPSSYNYRITRRADMRDEDARLDLTDLVHIHYMRSFHVPGFLETLQPQLDRDSEQFRWLSERLPLRPLIQVDPDSDDGAPTWKEIRAASRGQLARKGFGDASERE